MHATIDPCDLNPANRFLRQLLSSFRLSLFVEFIFSRSVGNFFSFLFFSFRQHLPASLGGPFLKMAVSPSGMCICIVYVYISCILILCFVSFPTHFVSDLFFVCVICLCRREENIRRDENRTE